MIIKKNKTLAFAIAFSVVSIFMTVLLLSESSDNSSYFSFFSKKTELETSYEKIDKLIQENDSLMQQLKLELEHTEELEYENNLMLNELDFKNKQIDSLEKNVRSLENLKNELKLAIRKQKGIISSFNSSTTAENGDQLKNNIKSVPKELLKKDTLKNNKSIKKTSQIESSPIQEIVRDEYDEVRLLNLDIKTLFTKGNNIKKETTNANKVNTIEVNYTLYRDKDSNESTNKFYIQIFDTNNRNLVNTYIANINGKELVYSYISEVESDKLVNTVKGEYSLQGLNLHEGIYFFNIFNSDGRLLSSRSFRLD